MSSPPQSEAVRNALERCGADSDAVVLGAASLEKVSEQPSETPGQTAERPDTDQPLLLSQLVAMGILDEPDAGREGWTTHVVGEPPDIDRTPATNRQIIAFSPPFFQARTCPEHVVLESTRASMLD